MGLLVPEVLDRHVTPANAAALSAAREIERVRSRIACCGVRDLSTLRIRALIEDGDSCRGRNDGVRHRVGGTLMR
jgi:hypothetical protein